MVKIGFNVLNMQLPNHGHTGAFGLTGSGKSFFSYALSMRQNRQLIYLMNVGKDPTWTQNNWLINNISYPEKTGWNDEDKLKLILEYEEKNLNKKPIVINDIGRDFNSNLEYLWKFKMLNKNLSMLILADEGHRYQKSLEKFLIEGRKHNVSVVYTSIRPETIKNVDITGNTPHIIIFATSDKMRVGLRKNYGINLPREVIEWTNDFKEKKLDIQYKFNSVFYNNISFYLLDKNFNVVKIINQSAIK